MRLRMNPPLLVLSAALAFVGCGSLSLLPARDVACDFRPAKSQCTDLRDSRAPTTANIKLFCEAIFATIDGGTYTEDARCDVTGSLGGCQTANVDGSKQTNWYYPGSRYPDEAAARAECSGPQQFVPPQ